MLRARPSAERVPAARVCVIPGSVAGRAEDDERTGSRRDDASGDQSDTVPAPPAEDQEKKEEHVDEHHQDLVGADDADGQEDTASGAQGASRAGFVPLSDKQREEQHRQGLSGQVGRRRGQPVVALGDLVHRREVEHVDDARGDERVTSGQRGAPRGLYQSPRAQHHEEEREAGHERVDTVETAGAHEKRR